LIWRSNSHPAKRGAVARVLVVDDEPDVRSVIVDMLEANGHAASSAAAAEAASTLQRQAFDALVTDIVMPEVSGWDLIEIARQRMPQMAVIAISGGGRYLRQEAALKISEAFGADVTLLKPFNETQLLNAVAVAMRRRGLDRGA
jgi:CheY-like chemotaxis protein